MKITVITGSPRKNGNSLAMTRAFIKEAEKCGHTINLYDAVSMNISGCHACMTCYKTGRACTFNKDFDAIASSIFDSDGVLFAMPVYWYSIPAQIKGVIDCLFSLVAGEKNVSGKKWGLITCCEENDMSVMDGVRIPMEKTASLLKWNLAGEVLIPDVLNEGEIENTDGCRLATELAHKF